MSSELAGDRHEVRLTYEAGFTRSSNTEPKSSFL